MHNPAVTGAIVGARNAEQAEGLMRAGELLDRQGSPRDRALRQHGEGGLNDRLQNS